MADVFSKMERSSIMSRIRSKNTKPEIIVRKALFSRGYRYRIHDDKLPGRPDVVLKKYNTVIFVHGCFWHGHNGCKYHVIPSSNKAFWTKKIEHNKDKDIINTKKLRKLGWRVLNVWECELKKTSLQETITKMIKMLENAK